MLLTGKSTMFPRMGDLPKIQGAFLVLKPEFVYFLKYII